MKKTLLIGGAMLGVLLTCVSLTGCCGKYFCEEKNPVAITSGSWELELDTLAGADRSWQKPERDITLVFQADGKFSGCAGVNRYFGKAEWDMAAHTLKFGNAGVTMMAGPGLEYEGAYLKMLATVDSYEVVGDNLYLKSQGKTVAEFDHETLADLAD